MTPAGASRRSERVELRWITLARTALWGLAVGAALATVTVRFSDPRATIVQHQGRPLIGAPFHLTSHLGNDLSDGDLKGRPFLLTFGYTRDGAQTAATLQVVSAVLGRLGGRADRVAAIFVTLDPRFDTPVKLLEYLRQFDRHLIGATGSVDQIAALANAYRLPHGPLGGADASPPGGIAYEPLIFLMNSRGEYVTHWTQQATVEDIAEFLVPRL